ncbi:hypothetical protein [Paucibacter soli]|uniref:hypothetical protein n=1 Tax=Paucibacter soli TaxID=3133433 RepID=UPI0030B07E37
MTYQSVTTWQAEDFEVEVRYGYFGTVEGAAAMARNGIEGIFLDGAGLWVDLRDRTRAPVRDDSFTVRRLRETSRAEARHRVLTIDDFEPVTMTLDEMRRDPDMRKGFGSLAYGVVDAEGKPVALPPQS